MKQVTGNRETANEMNKEDPTQGIPVWLQPFTVNLEELEAHVLAHSSERRGCFKSGDTKRKHSVRSYFRKKPKEIYSAIRKSIVGDLTTVEHKILNEGRESRNNHRYAVVVQVLATQWNPCQIKTSQETEKNSRKFTETAAESIRIWQVL